MVVPSWTSINAITFATSDMAADAAFFQDLGLVLTFGGKDKEFSTLGLGGDDNTFHVNLFLDKSAKPDHVRSWGRVIIYVDDVDAMYALAKSKGYEPEFAPSDAPWGERYFHIRCPAGHEISFAKKIADHTFWQTGKLAPVTSRKGSDIPKTLLVGAFAGCALLIFKKFSQL